MNKDYADWKVMEQNLRVVPCDPRCPEQWQVPVTNGNVIAMVYGGTTTGDASREECLTIARQIAALPQLVGTLAQIVRHWETVDRRYAESALAAEAKAALKVAGVLP